MRIAVLALAFALTLPAYAGFITNGGFEAGFAGWTALDQIGGDGSFVPQTGTLSPVNGFTVPPPPEGSTAAMTDALAPGSHVLYQDFVVPIGLPGAIAYFFLFINNGNGAPDFFTPPHLDFATPDLNQRARVDLMTTAADPFSMAPGDVLQNLFETRPGDPLVSGYNSFAIDVSSHLLMMQGKKLRLRFAAVDNVAPFNFGVDRVDINVIPEPSTWIMTFAALLGAGFLCKRLRKQ
jgi:hypothetical protein